VIRRLEAEVPGVGRCEVFELEHRGGLVRVVVDAYWRGVGLVLEDRRPERFIPADDPELAELLYQYGFPL
jgi:hypothetical protein